MYDFVKQFPNNIFIPKIVPLVYDDTLSYYEFVCKLLNKLEQIIDTLNELGVKVDALEQAVSQLQDIVNGLDGRLTIVEGDVSDLKTAVQNINTVIEGINTTISNLNNRVETVENNITTINNSIESINQTIINLTNIVTNLEDLSDDVSALQGDVSGLDTRVDALEEATFGDITVSPINGNYSYDMHDLSGVDYDIETISGTGDNSTVFVNTNDMIAFHKSEEGYVVKQLRLKNFLTNLNAFDNNFGSLELNFGFCFQVGGLEFNKQVEFANGMTVTGLLTGYTGGTYFTSIKLEANSDNVSYDLLIDCNDYEGAYVIQLEYLFCVAGEVILSQSNMRKYVGLPTSNLIALIKKNSKDYDAAINAIEADILDLEGDIGSLNTTVTNQGNAITGLSNTVTSQGNTITSQGNRITALETPVEYTSFSDVFETIPEGLNVLEFRLIKSGKTVTITMTGSGLDASQNFSTYKLGSIKSGLRATLAPRNGKPIVFTGATLHRTEDTPPRISVAASGIKIPSASDISGVAVGVLTGNENYNPFNPTTQYVNRDLDTYSLLLGITNYVSGLSTGFSFTFTYVTN